MKRCRIATTIISIWLSTFTQAANPFLDAPADKPTSAKFQGTEWGDEIQQHEIPLTARVVTTRLAKMPWGAIFKIEFTALESRAPQKREIRPDYFIVTDDRIVLLNEEDKPPLRRSRRWINRRNSSRVTSTELRLVNSVTKMAYGKPQSA